MEEVVEATRLDDGDSQMPIECQAALRDSPRSKRQ